MSTKTVKKIVELEETKTLCDICGEQITGSSNRKCGMCDRDVHAAGPGSCSVYDRENGQTTCSVCHKLGDAFRQVVERCREQTDEAYAKWRDACQEHRYDTQEGDGGA